jgi:YD repeat-containing protein
MSIRNLLLALLLAVSVVSLQQAVAEEIRDYYSEPGLNPFKETLNENFTEQIDPFSGTLQLKYSDVHIPGNGGMDIDITRTYTSLQTNAYPKTGRLGLGWTMHFGRIVASRTFQSQICNQATFPLTTRENPSLELPDGGRELLVLSNQHSDGTLLTRSNWRARCGTGGVGLVVTSPDGRRYTMDRFDYGEEEPSWLTSRIEDLNGNWIAIDYETNAAGVNFIESIRRSEEGAEATVVAFEYEDEDEAGIAISAIHANGQTWGFEYDSIPGYMFDFYKQLVRVVRPDGTRWQYTYNPKFSDPDPNDGIIQDGPASYSLARVEYPHGAQIDYTYQYVLFDPGEAVATTAIATKVVSGQGVAGGTWTYAFAPHSAPYNDSHGGQLRHDVTTVTAPEAIYRYQHFGKDFRSVMTEAGLLHIFVRPAYVGTLSSKETFARSPGGAPGPLLEWRINSWELRKISEEDFWHGAGYRDWWRDDGTYVPVLTGEFMSRDSYAAGALSQHTRRYYEHDVHGNPGRMLEFANVQDQPERQVRYTYFNDTEKWIIGLPQTETHESVVGEIATPLGTVEREYDADGQLRRLVDFGEETLYTYTTQGDVRTVRDARGNTTTFGNYKRGVARLEERPESVTIYRVVNDTGTLASETSGRGHITSFGYDGLNRLTSINYPIGADVSVQYVSGFGVYRRILTRGNYRQTESINDFGEMRSVQREDLVSGQSIVRESTFDALGRKVFESYPNSAVGTATSYDALGRVSRIVHPDTAEVAYQYDDQVVTIHNERGFQTRFSYLVYGLDFGAQEPVLIDEPESVSTLIRRDTWGNVLLVFQGQLQGQSISGHGRTYRYDQRRLLVESSEPEVGITVLTHDAVGNVASEQVNTLQAVTFQYDGLNRRTRVDFADDTPDVVTQYDANGNPQRVTKGATEWVYAHDENDNLRTETLTISHPLFEPRVYTTVHDYNIADVLAQTIYPSGLAVAYEPDAFGRATRIGAFASNVTYHPSGSLAGYELANGKTVSYALNQRLLTQSVAVPGVVDLSYDYDEAGNVTQILDGIDPSHNVLMNVSGYDGLNRLLRSTGQWGTMNFSYDHHGNIVNREVGQDRFRHFVDGNGRMNRVERVDPASPDNETSVLWYEFDRRGNAIAKRRYTNVTSSGAAGMEESGFEYDAASHLVRTSFAQSAAAGQALVATKDFSYDGNGQRVVEQKHGSYDIRFSVYGSGGQLLFEDSITECTRTDYVRLGALNVARSDDRPANPVLDTDGDTIPDCVETQLGLNPASAADASADRDSDGLSNLEEFLAGTALHRSDTDGDGLSDFAERNVELTDPTRRDSDGDGIGDLEEVQNPSLDPGARDSDHDGVSDSDELRLATNPAGGEDAWLDTDGDGFSDRQESMAGSDPLVAASKPQRGTQLWSFNALSSLSGSAVIGPDRTVYVSETGGKLHAIRPDGTRRWTFQKSASLFSEPTVGPDGTIYVVSQLNGGVPSGSPRSHLIAISPDGTQRWTVGSLDLLSTAASIGPDGRVLVASSRFTSGSYGSSVAGLVLAFTREGAPDGFRSLAPAEIVHEPSVSVMGDIIVGADDSTLYALDASLQTRWTYRLWAPIASPASIATDGTVYVTDESGFVYALSSSGDFLWERRLPEQSTLYSSLVIGQDGMLYVGGYGSRLFAIRAIDGSIAWNVPTSGTTFTPAVGANGTVYAATYGGDLMAFDAAGVELWRTRSRSNLRSSPILDRDGTAYFGNELGQLIAVADNSGGPAGTAWAMYRHDSAGTSYSCFKETAFSIVADSDGDQIDDCAELRYGFDPSNPADGAADEDGDGLANWREHQLGTRLDLADTDGDGLSDGVEFHTHGTDPTIPDSDHDGTSDSVELQLGTNPLDASDVAADSDGDGFSNRQEALAGTDPQSAGSAPVIGQVLRQQSMPSFFTTGGDVSVGRDGTLYVNRGSHLEALHSDFTRKWIWNEPIRGVPAIGRDGTIYAATPQGLVALLPNGTLRWSASIPYNPPFMDVYTGPVVTTDGYVYVVQTGNHSQGDLLHGYDANGEKVATRQVFARTPLIAAASDGYVVSYDAGNALSKFKPLDTGAYSWRATGSDIIGGGSAGLVLGQNNEIFISNGGSVRAIDALGNRIWSASGTAGHPLIDSSGRLLVYCASVTNLCALDPATGAVMWTGTAGLQMTGTATIDVNGSILALLHEGGLSSRGPDGTSQWQTPVAGLTEARYPVVLADGTVFVEGKYMRVIFAGAGHGAGNTAWPSRHRGHRSTRGAGDLSDLPIPVAPVLSVSLNSTQTTRVDVGRNINATVTAADFQDGALGAGIRWTSSLSGPVGVGPQLALGQLPIGMHVLTISVDDTDGNTTSVTRTVEVGAFPPELSIYNPVEGAIFDHGQEVQFSGSAHDVADGDISAQIVWSSDRDGTLATAQFFSTSGLTVGAHRIMARSTDSTGIVSSTSVNIVVQPVPPTIEIYSPEELQQFEVGLPVQLQGYAYDGGDGELSSLIQWSSDLDGELGTGQELEVSTLRAGTHVITARVTDSSGATVSATRPITIGHQPPQLSVQSPGYYSTVSYGSSVSFQAEAWDVVDGNLEDAVQWTSSLDGLLGTGSFGLSPLSVGMHLITASVTDTHGMTASQQRYLIVQSQDNTAPYLSISSPAAGTQFYLNDPVTLAGTAYDTQEGVLSSVIEWSSDRDGPLGTGASVTVATLSVGTHTIRALAEDGYNGKGAATVQITVLPIPPDYPPTIRFTSIGVGARYTGDSAFALSAVASDREDGDISSRLQWTSSLDGPLGNGATVHVSGLTPGVHDITARVVDNYGNIVTKTQAVEIFTDGDSEFVNDGFSVATGPNALAGWQKFDDGTSFPSNWFLTGGQLAEFGNAQAGATGASAIEKPGTYMRQTAGMDWLDYRLEATLRSTDNDGIGLMFRYTDNNNYYRFSMDSERGFRRVVRKLNGVYTLLWQDAVPYVVGQTYEVAITAVGADLSLAIDGVELWSGTDASHRRGTIALYAWSESVAYFDNIRVINLRTTESNDPPQLGITSPANNSTFVVGSTVALTGSAPDFEDGDVSQDIAWSSSLDGLLGIGQTLNLNSLQIGLHEITATVTDSDGAMSTATLNLTISPPFNEPPTVGITAPAGNVTINLGDLLNLAGTANDIEDGDISNLISWSSSRDGALAIGANATVSLSAGAHVITATITDSGTKTATATRNVMVAVPGNDPPVITLAAPLNGAAFQAGQTVALTATATDPQDGSLTALIGWTSSINGALGTGGSLNVSTLSGGVHTITATVSDGVGEERSATATITVVPTAGVLLRDDFSDNNYNGWTVTNEGTLSGPAVWGASTGALRQTSDLYSTPTTAATIPKPGTFARYTAGSVWTNYSITTELRSSDNDVLGVMFRYTSASNYYRFSMDSERANRRLSKKRNGTWTTLWSDSVAYQLNRTYVLEIIANGANITVKLDGVQLWSGTDSQALTTGTVAMYSWWNNGSQFDNVLVRNLAVPLASVAPRRPPEPFPEREPLQLVMLPRRGAFPADALWSLL